MNIRFFIKRIGIATAAILANPFQLIEREKLTLDSVDLDVKSQVAINLNQMEKGVRDLSLEQKEGAAYFEESGLLKCLLEQERVK